MKSLIEESSSIAKAVEKGWERAGKPQSFSIKIFELPEKNFLGITTKYAKVGIFFGDEKTSSNVSHTSHKKEHTQPHNTPKNKKIEKHSLPENSTKNDNKNTRPTKPLASERIEREESKNDVDTTEPSVIWSEDMVQFISNWLKNSLVIMGYHSLKFSTNISSNHLKVQFDRNFIENNAKQAQFFRGLSYIIMASIRAKFKTDLKGLRVIFSCQ